MSTSGWVRITYTIRDWFSLLSLQHSISLSVKWCIPTKNNCGLDLRWNHVRERWFSKTKWGNMPPEFQVIKPRLLSNFSFVFPFFLLLVFSQFLDVSTDHALVKMLFLMFKELNLLLYHFEYSSCNVHCFVMKRWTITLHWIEKNKKFTLNLIPWNLKILSNCIPNRAELHVIQVTDLYQKNKMD